jgi:hypothetical protein
MYVQVIEGRTKDPEGLKQQGERWQTEMRPGAIGYLGVTAGATADGRAISMVRFESEDAAKQNSDRPEQGAWWGEMQKNYDGQPTFAGSSDVQEFLGGGSNDAGFVQVMKVSGVDRKQIERIDASFEKFADLRPDILGGLRVWTGPDSYVEAAYFTSEADARKGEQVELPDDLKGVMAEFGELMGNTEFFDITDPQLR